MWFPGISSCSDVLICHNSSGVKNVVKACRECGIKRLIYNSSADVVFDEVHDICGGDESLPYSGQVCVLLKL